MKRFYKTVAVEAADTGHVITLDGKLVKTPGRAMLVLPTRALADAVAAEWDAQADEIEATSMHQTQLANTALDRVARRHEEVVREVTAFGGTDLLCYRADEQDALLEKQVRLWDPYLHWAQRALGAGLKTTRGIMPVAQDDAALRALTAHVMGLDAFELTAAHALTNGFGSLILALAYMCGESPLEAVWQASILDATHQAELWGEDWEAAEKRAADHAEIDAAARFLLYLRS